MSYDNCEKNKIKLASLYDVPFSSDRIIPSVAYDFLAIGEKLQKAANKFCPATQTTIFPDDIDWDDSECKSILNGFGNLLNHDFETAQTGTKSNELHTAMNLPIICAINQYVPTLSPTADVCIIGADRGQNITQCEIARGSKPVGWNIVAIEPNSSALNALEKTLAPYSSHRVIPYTLQEAYARNCCNRDGKPIKFDLIIHNLGMHVACPNDIAREAYASFMEHHLKDGGVALCTSVDIDAVKRADDLGLQSPSRSIQILQEYPPSPAFAEGMAIVRVDASTFQDPILSAGAIFGMFGLPPFEVKIVPGRYLFRDNQKMVSNYVPLFEPAKYHQNAARRPEVAILLYIEIRKGQGSFPILPPIDYKAVDAEKFEWKEVTEFSANEVNRCHFPYNHGRPLTSPDLVFLDPLQTFIAPKRNGIAGRMSVSRGVALILLEDNRKFKAIKLPAVDNHDMQIQVEVMEDQDGIRVMALDPYRIGKASPTMFADRWGLLKAIYNSSRTLPQLFHLQTYRVATRENISIVVDYWRKHPQYVDGIVLQNKWAMPGSFKHHLGSARYLKDAYTIDIAIDKEIWEVDFDSFQRATTLKDIIRLKKRPDKKQPNTLLQYHSLQVALKLDAWEDHVELTQHYEYRIPDVPTFCRVLADEAQIHDIPFEEKIKIYRGRYSDYECVRDLIGGFPDHMKDHGYSRYMYFKHAVLRDVIAEHHEMMDKNLLSPCAIISGDQLKFFETIVEDKVEDIHGCAV
jgi:hypothetical protein